MLVGIALDVPELVLNTENEVDHVIKAGLVVKPVG